MIREKTYVRLYYPGALVAETADYPVNGWSVPHALELARAHPRPMSFMFVDMLESDAIDDGRGGKMIVMPKELRRSKMHFLDGIVSSLAEVEAKNAPDESILRANMRGNGYTHVVRMRGTTREFHAGDAVVDLTTGAVSYPAGK